MKALFSMLVVLGLSCLKAQSPAYRLFTMREGLSQMKITSLHLDVRGYLWIGTRNGLNKFDGEKFTVYTEKQGLLHNRIHGLDQDNKGNLVILTYNGLCFYDGEKFTSFPSHLTACFLIWQLMKKIQFGFVSDTVMLPFMPFETESMKQYWTTNPACIFSTIGTLMINILPPKVRFTGLSMIL